MSTCFRTALPLVCSFRDIPTLWLCGQQLRLPGSLHICKPRTRSPDLPLVPIPKLPVNPNYLSPQNLPKYLILSHRHAFKLAVLARHVVLERLKYQDVKR